MSLTGGPKQKIFDVQRNHVKLRSATSSDPMRLPSIGQNSGGFLAAALVAEERARRPSRDFFVLVVLLQ